LSPESENRRQENKRQKRRSERKGRRLKLLLKEELKSRRSKGINDMVLKVLLEEY
jgi:hypothetical protein